MPWCRCFHEEKYTSGERARGYWVLKILKEARVAIPARPPPEGAPCVIFYNFNRSQGRNLRGAEVL